MNERSWVDRLFLWTVAHRNPLVFVCKITFWIQALILVLGSWSIATQESHWVQFYDVARESGEYGIVLFILSSVPGIFRRFGISHRFVSILMMFRRYIGISACLFAAIHAGILKIVPWIVGIFPLYPIDTFILFGIVAFVLLLLLCITSNDWSIKKLGNWWGKIHDLTYSIVWLIFIHVALQGLSVWSVIIGVTALFQVSSHIFVMWKRHDKQVTV